MGDHLRPGRERWRATRRSIRFTSAAIIAVPVAALIAILALAGVALGQALAKGGRAPEHGPALVRIAIADVVGLAAVLLSVLALAWFARRLSRDVASLDATARRFAGLLPQFVERLRRVDQVGPDSELSAVAPAKITEVARAAEALATVQRTAVAAAAAEAGLRDGISKVFVSLARRNQSLLQRQLHLLDDLERKAADPAALAELFPLDHLTTRMRRHAEGLIILSGAVPGRAWSSPVPVIDVIRGAIAEVEDYQRVVMVTTSDDTVAGSAVADMIHLLAELIENATLFSPSGTPVEVRAERAAHGFAIEVEDRGLGMKSEELDAVNERLGQPTDFDLADADQLGLFVVTRLADRHRVRVFLRANAYGGITATVIMPPSMVRNQAEAAPGAELAVGHASATPGDLQLALTGRRPPRFPPAAGGVAAHIGAAPGPRGSVAQGSVAQGSVAEGSAVPDSLPQTASAPAAIPPAAVPPGEMPPEASPHGASPPTAVPPGSAQPTASPRGNASGTGVPPGTAQPTGVPPAAVPPGTVPQAAVPPGTIPPGTIPPGTIPPGTIPPGTIPPRAASPGSAATGGTHRGLPRRVRQASLSPHLRQGSPPGPAAEPDARTPEQAQNLLTSMQSGWERGRRAEVPDSGGLVGAEEPSDTARDAPQEEQ